MNIFEDKFVDDYFLTKTSNRIYFDILESASKLENNLFALPKENQSIKMISPAGGWSSCSLLVSIASKLKIKSICLTTLRVGKKELDELVNIKNNHNCYVEIGLGTIQRENNAGGRIYDYSDYFEMICEDEGIIYNYVRNHSKVILIEAEEGYFVIETSSNFNENPKIEQFSFENSKDLYFFYMMNLKKLGVFKNGRGGAK